ncbi:CFEM domain-containing protein [Podospora didyma]|uniref:CFEM domain-containing protein n=1 Tax=Podospora didyma TaxID=330526 RepID=A0AAE0U7E3_9PEZI|nr:CFEM domain-containing protein [Podospora didyma]
MKLSFINIVAGTLLVASGAQSQLTGCAAVAVSVIPSCAQTCFLEGAPTIGCSSFDFACQCQQEAALYAAIEGCVASSCPDSESQNVIDGAAKVCECAMGGPSSNAGSQTVSGTLVPPSSFVPSFTGSFVSSFTGSFVLTNSRSFIQVPSTATATETAVPVSEDENGAGSGSPTTASPSYYATSKVISAASPQSRLGLGFIFSVCGVAFALVDL